MLLLSFLFFTLLFIITFYIPGRHLLRISRFSFQDTVSQTTVSFGLGIAGFLVALYTLSWIHGAYFYYFFIVYCLIRESFEFYKAKQKFFITFSLDRNVFLILLGSFFTVSLVWMSGMITQQGMQFFGVNAVDGIVHMSLIHQFIDQFPPITPYLAGVPFRGYHFFYDFMIANFAILFPFFSVTDLFFRFSPIFLALFYGFSGLFFAKHYKMNKVGISLFLFLLYFAQGLQSVVPFLLQKPDTALNTGIIQSLQHIFDPTVLFATAFIFLLVPLYFSAKTKREFFFVILLLGILPMLKIYAAIMIYLGFGMIVLFSLIKNKDIKPFLIILFSALLSIYVYVPLNFGAGKLLFAPFLLYRHFIEGSSALSWFQWALKYQFYAAQHNVLHIIWLYVIAILWYFIPTLGLRLVLLFNMGNLKKKTFYSPENIFWTVVCLVGFLIPTFFIQSVDVFNILQFLWFSYIFLLIPTAITLSKYFSKNTLINIFLCLTILVLSLPDTWSLFWGYRQVPTIIDTQTIQMSEIIHAKVPKRDAIIVLGKSFYSPVMAAITGRQIYYESTSLGNVAMDTIGKTRQKKIADITDNLSTCNLPAEALRTALQSTRVQYVLLFEKSTCFPANQPIARVGQEVLYKL